MGGGREWRLVFAAFDVRSPRRLIAFGHFTAMVSSSMPDNSLACVCVYSSTQIIYLCFALSLFALDEEFFLEFRTQL